MNKFVSTLIVCVACIAGASAKADTATTPAQAQVPVYSHQGKLYPPVLFATNIKQFDIKTALSNAHAFESIDQESLGLPIAIRVLHGENTAQNGKNIATGIMAGATLGLLPVVSNKTYSVRYDVFVQGRSIAFFEYEMPHQDVENLWAKKDAAALSPAAQNFLNGSVSRFLVDLRTNKDVQAVFNEYNRYFSE